MTIPRTRFVGQAPTQEPQNIAASTPSTCPGDQGGFGLEHATDAQRSIPLHPDGAPRAAGAAHSHVDRRRAAHPGGAERGDSYRGTSVAAGAAASVAAFPSGAAQATCPRAVVDQSALLRVSVLVADVDGGAARASGPSSSACSAGPTLPGRDGDALKRRLRPID